MASEDYVAGMAAQMENLDFAQQTSFSMGAVILFDTAWFGAVNEILGREKAYEITTRAWNIIGERTAQLMRQQLGYDKITEFEQLKAVIQAGYRAWLIPITINQENEDLFEYECLACPFPAYGIGLFDVKEGDYGCQVWKAMTPAWIDGIISEAGLTGLYKADIASAICCGDSTCKVTVAKVEK